MLMLGRHCDGVTRNSYLPLSPVFLSPVNKKNSTIDRKLLIHRLNFVIISTFFSFNKKNVSS
jgi:hypothetical protein